MAACGGMPNTATFRNTWSIDWHCTSPPGVPSGMNGLPSLKTIAGHGREARPLAAGDRARMALPAHDCEPRDETPSPVPGVIGALRQPSLGVAEKMLPRRSTAHTYVVSSVSAAAGSGARGRSTGAAAPLPRDGSPGGRHAGVGAVGIDQGAARRGVRRVEQRPASARPRTPGRRSSARGRRRRASAPR